MNGPIEIIPPRKGAGGRNDAVHAAIYRHFMIYDLSAEDTAKVVNEAHGTVETRNSIISYSNRQGWLKGTGSGPKRHKPMNRGARTPSRPKPVSPGGRVVNPERAKPLKVVTHAAPRAELEVVPDLVEVEIGPNANAEGTYRMRVHSPNPLSAPFYLIDQPDENGVIKRSCHFPVGPDCPGRMDEHMVCGRPRHPDQPYCRPHMKVACPGGA